MSTREKIAELLHELHQHVSTSESAEPTQAILSDEHFFATSFTDVLKRIQAENSYAAGPVDEILTKEVALLQLAMTDRKLSIRGLCERVQVSRGVLNRLFSKPSPGTRIGTLAWVAAALDVSLLGVERRHHKTEAPSRDTSPSPTAPRTIIDPATVSGAQRKSAAAARAAAARAAAARAASARAASARAAGLSGLPRQRRMEIACDEGQECVASTEGLPYSPTPATAIVHGPTEAQPDRPTTAPPKPKPEASAPPTPSTEPRQEETSATRPSTHVASPPVDHGYFGHLPHFDFFKENARRQPEVSTLTEQPTADEGERAETPPVDASANASASAEPPETVEFVATAGANAELTEAVEFAATSSYAGGVGVSLASAGLSAESSKVAIGTAGIGVLLYAAGRLTEQEDAATARTMKNFGAGLTVTTAMVQVKRGLLSLWRSHKERSSDAESPAEGSPQENPSPEDSATAEAEAATVVTPEEATAAAPEAASADVASESNPTALEEPSKPETLAEAITEVLDAEPEPEDLSAEIQLPAANDRPSGNRRDSADDHSEPTPIDARLEHPIDLKSPQQSETALDPVAEANALLAALSGPYFVQQPSGGTKGPASGNLNQAPRQQRHEAQQQNGALTYLMALSDDELRREFMDPHSAAFAELARRNRPQAQPLPAEIEAAFEWLRKSLEQPSG